jgi:hypothetical protein
MNNAGSSPAAPIVPAHAGAILSMRSNK